MKRLMVLIWNLGVGGMQKRMKDIFIQISNDYPDWEVYVLVKNKNPRCFNQLIEDLPRVYVSYFPQKHIFWCKFSSLPWLIREYIRIRPHVSLTFLSHLSLQVIFTRLLCFWHRSKLILNEGVFTSKFLPIHEKHPKLHKLLIRLFYNNADMIITPSAVGKTDLVNNYRVKSNNVKVIPSWTLFSKKTPVKNKYDLVYIGRFAKEKKLVQLVNIVKLLSKTFPQIRILMVGEGESEFEIKARVLDLHLADNFVFIPVKDNVINYLRQSKIFVMTSVNEGIPNVVLEAAMCGLPSVVNNFEGASEVICDGKTGYIVKSQDEMVQKISILLKDIEKNRKMGINAQKFIGKNFGFKLQDNFIKELIRI